MSDREQVLSTSNRAQTAILQFMISAGGVLIAIGIVASLGESDTGLVISAVGFGLMILAVAIGRAGEIIAAKLKSGE